ncbi:MAG: Ribosomal protein L19E [Candidatus Methanohalarchaeum thermophilum]|uniref:Large ribosomal subunit protein eL19 n=1 Tax=Methanohalarchaeum thermophilum TaxID=1903181 RepID=A0A1Q6DX10_METT1|nr:MAG: Ribosomal protein L19E [Candidatus Methanohalarchaeum thermophilum]
MSDLRPQKRMASDILDVGENKIWLDPSRQEDISSAITREDVKELIDEGAITSKKEKGNSRGRIRERQDKKKRSQKKGQGKRKGTKTARNPRKKEWMNKIRAQREILKEYRDEGKISRNTYRKYYKKSKGGEFEDIRHLKTALEEEIEEVKE